MDGQERVRVCSLLLGVGVPPASSVAEGASGRGSAGGGGYHKESAALEDAFTSAGVKFEAHFGGAGEAAMARAIAAVGAFFGVEGKVI